MHELDKLDHHFNLPVGTSRHILVEHNDPSALNKVLVPRGITLDKHGMVPKLQWGLWNELLVEAGVDAHYRKGEDLTPQGEPLDGLPALLDDPDPC